MKAKAKNNHKLSPLIGYRGRSGKSVYECSCGLIAEGWNLKEATKAHLSDIYDKHEDQSA